MVKGIVSMVAAAFVLAACGGTQESRPPMKKSKPVAANQADEIVVVDPTGKAIAKLGDFNGLKDGA